MAKCWSVTSLLALALLGCLVGTEVEAQAPQYPQAPPFVPPALPPKVPQYPQYPKVPPVLPPALPPKVPQYPQAPQVLPPPPPPKTPQYPQAPQVLPPPPPPKTPQYPQAPKVLPPPPPPKAPQYPQVPPVPPPPPPPKAPQYPQAPKVLPPPPPPKAPQYPQAPQVLPPPPPPKTPQYPQAPQVLPPPPPPKVPQYPPVPQPQQPQSPAVPQTPSTYKPRPVQSCEVAVNVRIPCGAADVSAAGCDALNCCFDGRDCYFGKAVTVQCTKDAQFIVVVARDATLPNIDLDSISLLGQGQSCTHVDSNSEFAIYQFPVTACSSVVMEEPGVIIYQNRMSSSYEVGVGPLGAITRDSQYELLFQCRYIGTSVETLVVEVLPLQDPPLPVAALGPIRVQLKLANGQCNTKGCNEVDVAYSSFYTEADYPVTKVLRDPVYVQVQLIEKTDPNLILTLGRCWTTTSPNPHSLPQWDILIDGCPYRDDRYLSSLVPVGPFSGVDFPSHYRRFIFKMFTFVDPKSMEPLKEQVYIHCSTAVCSAALGRSCEPSCFRKKRDVKAADQKTDEPKVVVSVGPVIMGAPEQ
ncbi:zona pellucida sperm-binding protein 4-like [Siniperca chuatsi]|uniref:zona pellucida sperm-binding protein 4-like n=1 Tax=Siniperca chuatsi TaxID=119488 RepID=UPI001CE1DFD6|nr:zona pellucida sperm-binding protein 4-like [Siniperca chuatsi]